MQPKKWGIGIIVLILAIALIKYLGWTDSLKLSGSQDHANLYQSETAKPEEQYKQIPVKLLIKPQNDKKQDPQSAVTREIERIFNVDIEYVYLDRNKDTAMLNYRVTAGDIPDIMLLSPELFSTYVQQEVLAEIPLELIEQYAPTWLEQLKLYSQDNILDFYSIAGKLYGLPVITVDSNNFVPIWRDDWLRNVGIEKIPQSLEEAEEAFYKFVREDPDNNGKADTYALSNFGFQAIYGAFGVQPGIWLERNGEVRYGSALPEMKQALSLLHRWYKDGLIDPSFITGENKGQYWAHTVAFWNGKIGFSVPGTYYHVNPSFDSNVSRDSGSGNWKNFRELQGNPASYEPGMPIIGPDGHSGTIKWDVISGSAVGFGKDVLLDKRKMIKWLQMIEKLNTDEQYFRLANFGIEHEMWEISPATGLPTMKNAYQYNKGVIAAGPSGTAFQISNFEMFRRNTMSEDMLEFASTYAMLDNYYTNAVWALLPSDSKYKAELDQAVNKTFIQFITGQKSLDEWDSFVEELYVRYGLTELTEEANLWFEQYKK